MAPPPAMAPPAAPPAQAPGGGGGFLSGIMGGVVQGMALGTGSAIAHHAVDSIMGPRKVEHVHNNAPAPEAPAAPAAPAGSTPMQCANEYSTFQECVKNAGGDISACQFYMDMLSKCQKQFPSA
uniref:CHCH domain-containing protein n=1 Tax=Hanusia phi TaxID=3032 RepID=A0A7S0HSI8_9CRYP|mmetsp:Transcript_34996/g.79177  ORF Transcript_34996/g.79177 Transcript_34996/m.79177 type:complete len:124 (+) Transcript_34996:319-690(+)